MYKIIKITALALTFLSLSCFAEKRVLILGDSLTEGYGVSKDQAYPKIIEQTLIKSGYKDITIINAGESGSKTSSALTRLRWHLRSKPDVLILALGANDGLRGIKTNVIQANLQKTIDFALSKNIQVILAGMQMPINYGLEYRKRFEQIYLNLKKENKIILIPFLLDGVARVKELNLDDGIHPNEKGHKVIANTVINYLKKLL